MKRVFEKELFSIKRKGFTLIELLAVIVILAIILLIIMPIVLNIMSDARKGAFESTAMGLVKTAENQYMEDRLQGKPGAVDYLFDDWQQVGEEELNFSGRGAKDGIIRVNESGRIEVAISDGEWCAKKEFDETQVTVVSLEEDDCGIEEFGVYKVEYLAEELGSIDGESPQFLFQGDDTSPVIAEPNTDYSFVIWDDGYMNRNRQDFNISSSFITSAFFDLTANITYQVNVVVNPLGAGTVDLSGSTNGFNPGDTATVEVTEVTTGYEFVRWSNEYDAELSTDLEYVFDVHQNITLMAEFVIEEEPAPLDPTEPFDPNDPNDPHCPGVPCVIPIPAIEPTPIDPLDPHPDAPVDPDNPHCPHFLPCFDPHDPDPIPWYPDDPEDPNPEPAPWYPEVGDPCEGQETITIDGQEYDLIGIGTQCWMAENLNYTVTKQAIVGVLIMIVVFVILMVVCMIGKRQ